MIALSSYNRLAAGAYNKLVYCPDPVIASNDAIIANYAYQFLLFWWNDLRLPLLDLLHCSQHYSVKTGNEYA
jgi:hypothetical protein